MATAFDQTLFELKKALRGLFYWYVVEPHGGWRGMRRLAAVAYPIRSPISNFNSSVWCIFPLDWLYVRHAGGPCASTFVRIDSSHFPILKPNSSVVVVSEACSGLAILPSFVASLQLAIVRRPHRCHNLIFGITKIDQDGLLLQTAAADEEHRQGREDELIFFHSKTVCIW